MKIDLLNENTYALYDDKGEQVEQGPVTDEHRSAARIKAWTGSKSQRARLLRAVGRSKAIQVEVQPIALDIGGEMAEEPEMDDRYAEAEHEHDYAPGEHEHPHTHDDFARLSEALTEESRLRFKADSDLEAKYKSHLHPELAQVYHVHSDIYETFNVINNRITAVEASVPKETQAHQHNDLHERLNLITSEVTSLRNMFTGLENRIQEGIDNMVAAFNARVETLQPKGDFITRDEYNPLTQGKRKYRVKVVSQQNVDGKQHMNLEEV